jgi:predicted PurR-regulated permease PerM
MASDTELETTDPVGNPVLLMEGEAPAAEPAQEAPNPAPGAPSVLVVAVVLAVIAFLYFARPFVLPVLLACLASMALKPLMHGLSFLRIPTAPSAAIVFILLVASLIVGFVQLGRPAIHWIDDAPEQMPALRAKVQKLFPNAARVRTALDTMGDLGASEAGKTVEKAKTPTVKIEDQHNTTSILNWTGTVLAGLIEVLVLVYLILASGDMFMQKLVHVMPTLRDKKKAVEISHEVQTVISKYLFAVLVINICMGAVAAMGFWLLGVPRPAMWGMLVAILNFVPYFGPVVVGLLLSVVGLLTFDTLWQWLLPACWYLALHLLESNLVTPILLGRRFTLNPVAIFVSLMFWFWLWGVPGALVSVPILVSVKAICDRIPSASYVSELIGR